MPSKRKKTSFYVSSEALHDKERTAESPIQKEAKKSKNNQQSTGGLIFKTNTHIHTNSI